MKTLKALKSFERFEVEVGDETVTCTIDCTDTNINRIAAKAIAARDKVLALDSLKQKTTDLAKLDELSKKVAKTIEPVIVDGIGREGYDAILTACGDGVKLKPYQCNLVMVQVFAIVAQTVIERLAAVKESKAAHYLQDVVKDAQPGTDEEQQHI